MQENITYKNSEKLEKEAESKGMSCNEWRKQILYKVIHETTDAYFAELFGAGSIMITAFGYGNPPTELSTYHRT